MSDILVLADARTRGITLPTDDPVAQDILDETEAWLARQIGLLTGERTEQFYVGIAESRGRLGLARYADPETLTVTDGGATVLEFRLVERGSAIVHTHAALTRWWTGPYVEVTYEPADATDVRRVLYDLLALGTIGAAGSAGGGVQQSESIGEYSYTNGAASDVTVVPASRAALASSLLPKRNPLVTLYSGGRWLGYGDPVINRAEPTW